MEHIENYEEYFGTFANVERRTVICRGEDRVRTFLHRQLQSDIKPRPKAILEKFLSSVDLSKAVLVNDLSCRRGGLYIKNDGTLWYDWKAYEEITGQTLRYDWNNIDDIAKKYAQTYLVFAMNFREVAICLGNIPHIDKENDRLALERLRQEPIIMIKKQKEKPKHSDQILDRYLQTMDLYCLFGDEKYLRRANKWKRIWENIFRTSL